LAPATASLPPAKPQKTWLLVVLVSFMAIRSPGIDVEQQGLAALAVALWSFAPPAVSAHRDDPGGAHAARGVMELDEAEVSHKRALCRERRHAV
jgi:hypothetical protein